MYARHLSKWYIHPRMQITHVFRPTFLELKLFLYEDICASHVHKTLGITF
jgi:hypothetical protein